VERAVLCPRLSPQLETCGLQPMRKLEKLQIVKNVSSNWFALIVNVLVGIFLSPFILHRLGDAAFGIWVLIFSITGYYGLFDLGIRSSVVRYVSKAKATGETIAFLCEARAWLTHPDQTHGARRTGA